MALYSYTRWGGHLYPATSNHLYLQLIYSNPTVSRKALQHWYEKLKTTRPVANEQHHADKVEYAHEHAGHVEELKEKGMLFSGL